MIANWQAQKLPKEVKTDGLKSGRSLQRNQVVLTIDGSILAG